jgi:histone H3/H4
MDNLIVVSKVKKFIKEQSGLSTSSNFFEKLNEDIVNSLNYGSDHAKSAGRKTVMGRDFSIFTENPNVDESLVVASKVKKYIKDKEGLSTSSQAFDQLTYRVQKACLQAIENAKSAKRKTVMDRDFQEPNNA